MVSQSDSSSTWNFGHSPVKSPTSPLQRSQCEQQANAKTLVERMRRIKIHKLAIIKELKSYPDHEDGHFYQNAVEELQEIENSLSIAVSDFDSFMYVIPMAALFMTYPQLKLRFLPLKLACSFPK
ncbi:hypothetical protein TNCT_2891 [Trichonephila clavata]|uniref:Uncharacterized protein n=1 Tax=Trichonephila clavata TaxID=2740835 RepID=A0A8X6G2L2_TRICU|nr:hypothetical protein TNCT_2891 [Trichonephila clavata]